MQRRVLAVLFAIVVIAIGMNIRNDREEQARQGGERGQPGSPPPDSAPSSASAYDVFDDGSVRVLCVEELRATCERRFDLFGFTVRIEPAWTTVDRLAGGGKLGADAWLTFRPFDELAKATGSPDAAGEPTAVLARSPLALSGPPAAIAALDAACPDAATRFGCATAAARARHVALPDARTSAVGALVMAAVAHELGTPGEAATLTDPAVTEHLRVLARTGRRTQAPFEDVMRMGGEAVALTAEAEMVSDIAELEFEDQRRYDKAAVRYPLDVRSAEVVAVVTPTFRRRPDLERVLQSREASYAFERGGFLAEARESYMVDESPPLEGRPVVRTDLPPSGPLLRDIRRVVS